VSPNELAGLVNVDAYRICLELCQTIGPATMLPVILDKNNARKGAPIVWVRADSVPACGDTMFSHTFAVPLSSVLISAYARFREANHAASA
jgi:hypothetical protein